MFSIIKQALIVSRHVMVVVSVLVPSIVGYGQQASLTQVQNITLPGIVGDFDFFAVDLKRDRLFVAAEEHHSIELFQASTGKYLQSIAGVKTPHTLAYISDRDELFVADGGASACLILSGNDFHEIARIPLLDGSVTGDTDSPDAGYYDAKRRIFYVGNGGKSANLPYSEITEINVDTRQIVGKIRIETNNLEAFMIDDATNRLYANMRDQKKIAVVDLAASKVIDTWTTPDLNRNTALAIDTVSQRLFIVGRNPGLFYAFDLNTGKVVDKVRVANTADGMVWDPMLKRIYIMASQGLSVLHQDDKDHYTAITTIPTNGAKTGIYVPKFKQLYVIHPQTTIDDAGLLVYHVNSDK